MHCTISYNLLVTDQKIFHFQLFFDAFAFLAASIFFCLFADVFFFLVLFFEVVVVVVMFNVLNLLVAATCQILWSFSLLC